MQEGSFYFSVQRQSTWLPFRKTASKSFSQRFDDLLNGAVGSKHRKVSALSDASTPVSFFFPGGAFGVVLQEHQQLAGGLSHRKQPACFATKGAAIVFQGYLTNLDELIDELLLGALPELGSSAGSASDREPFHLESSGDQVLLSAEVVLQMFLRASHNNLLILLSDLQGQYAFTIYDSNRKQVFAARDPSGREPLYCSFGSDGLLAFTNQPRTRWSEPREDWQEVLPGHYVGGKNPKQTQQFALTPQQLSLRERVENMEDLSQQPFAVTGDGSPSSLRSSSELDSMFRLDSV
jgi:hypothetical protein